MKAMILAVGLIAVATTSAAAQYAPYGREHRPYAREHHPYAQSHHAACQEKAYNLHQAERRAAADGRISHREHDQLRFLRKDLDRSCAGYRWRG